MVQAATRSAWCLHQKALLEDLRYIHYKDITAGFIWPGRSKGINYNIISLLQWHLQMKLPCDDEMPQTFSDDKDE